MMNNWKKLLAGALAVTTVAMSAGCSAAAKDTSWVAKAGDITITPGTYIYYMVNNYGAATSKVADMAGDVLTQDVDGKTGSQWIADESLINVKRMLAIESKYSEMGLTLTEDEQAQVDDYANTQYESYKNFMEKNGIGVDSLKAYYANNFKTNSIFFKLYDEGGEKAIPEEELRQHFNDNYLNSVYLVCPKFDTATYAELDEAGLAKVKAEAEGYFKRVQDGESINDVLLDWEKANYSEEEIAGHQHDAPGAHEMVIAKDDTTAPAAFIENLSKAEMDKPMMFEDEYYHYVAVRKELTGTTADATFTNNRMNMVMALRSEEYKALCDQWAKEMEDKGTITVNQDALALYTPEKLNMAALYETGESSSTADGTVTPEPVPEDGAASEPASSDAASSEAPSSEAASSEAASSEPASSQAPASSQSASN